jgi:hypothetical protein
LKNLKTVFLLVVNVVVVAGNLFLPFEVEMEQKI